MLWFLLFCSQLDIYARGWKQYWSRSSQLVVALSWHCNIFYVCWPSVHTFIPRDVASVGLCRQDMAGIYFLSRLPFPNSILYLPLTIWFSEGYSIRFTACRYDLLGKLDFTCEATPNMQQINKTANGLVQLIAGPWGVSMNADLTFHRSGTGPARSRAGRVPSLPLPSIHPHRRPPIPDEGRSLKIYVSGDGPF